MFKGTEIRLRTGSALGRPVIGPAVSLRVAPAADESLRARVIGVVLQWLLPVIGLGVAGLNGGALAFAIASWAGASIAWFQFSRLPLSGERVA